MNLDFSPEEENFRTSVREWLVEHVPRDPLPSMDTTEGFAARREWERELAGAGYAVLTWPREYGGSEASLVEWLIFEEEYYSAGAPARVAQNGISLLAPTLFEYGTPEQLQRYLPPMARADEVWAQAWSEPEAGSDLAALKSVARRTNHGWMLSGQKTWSSRAAFADWGFGPFRSDVDTERHRGLTYFLFPLHADGVTVRPINRLDGDPGFAEIFFDEVFVPDNQVVGPVGNGWKVAMSTTASERGLNLRSPGRFLASADALLELWRKHGDPDAGSLRDRVIDVWIAAQAYRLYTFQTVARVLDGQSIGAESSLNKIFWSELDIELHQAALDLLGPRAERVRTGDGLDQWIDGYLFALSGPIYAGTNEIQRNVVAERLLGLPRGSR